MSILTLDKVCLAYGHHALLDHVDFQIARGERVSLVGRNGSGKSTLFNVINGTAQADDGEIWRKQALRISHLEQEVPADQNNTVYQVVAAGLGELGPLLTKYHNAVHHVAQSDEVSLDELSDLQHRIETMDGWNLNQKVDSILSRLSLPADKCLLDCSGGVRRRVMLAKALVSDPDLLLLDEPTNHMDITAITWLEEYLVSFQGALLFITHDRTFLRRLATRIIELDRGQLSSYPGDFDFYLRKKEQSLEIEARANVKFDKKLAEQEAWIRQGIKARRTRNEGRVRALIEMRKERTQRRETQGKVSLNVDSGEISGKCVADLQNVSFNYDDQQIVRDLSVRIMRGDRVGIIGPNGSGKSTLLKLILGELTPSSGQVTQGTKLQTAYFDQQREQLNPQKTVRDNISDGEDFISIKGHSRHVVGYLKDFLFPPQRIDSPVKSLSGGERNRLLLARIFTKPANMMVLDEPTNDLDVETLELLEDLLAEYDGTLLLVSHDRTFLDNVVTSTLVFEGSGRVQEYVGGYEDYIRQHNASLSVDQAINIKSQSPSKKPNKQTTKPKPATKLSYKEKRELEELPQKIETLEAEQQELEQKMSQSEFYQQEKSFITATLSRLDQIGVELQKAYQRWEYLDEIEG